MTDEKEHQAWLEFKAGDDSWERVFSLLNILRW